jgi:predicted GNAT family N-acyltransferase
MIEFINNHYNKTNFDCSYETLNNYIKFQAGQDIKRKLTACYVLYDTDSKRIQGYYTLSNNSIPLNDLPEIYKNKLPKNYQSIPTILLGRLAIDKEFKGFGYGKILLIDALKRSYEVSNEIGSFAVVVDPIDKTAEEFYSKYDFIKLPDSGKMFITMKTLKLLFS